MLFVTLSAWVENELQHDRLLAPHYRYYVREMRILAYTQLLESYRSLTLQYMATAFGVSTEFIDRWEVITGVIVYYSCHSRALKHKKMRVAERDCVYTSA